MNYLINKYSKQIGFFMVVGSILLFIPFTQTVIVSGFVTIVEPEKLSLTDYLMFIGESFIYHYLFHIPAIILLILGSYIQMTKKFSYYLIQIHLFILFR